MQQAATLWRVVGWRALVPLEKLMSNYSRAFLTLALAVCSNQLTLADEPRIDGERHTLVATIFGTHVYADDPRANRLFREISGGISENTRAPKELSPTS